MTADKDLAWRRSSVALGDNDPSAGQDCELLPILKLQAPPKSKCKRLLDSNGQPGVDRSDQCVPVVQGNRRKFPKNPLDRTQRFSTRDVLQPCEASCRFQHMSPSSSFSSNVKFKPPYGPIPSASRTYEAVISPRNAPSMPANFDQIYRCVSENCLTDTPSTSSHSPPAKVNHGHFKNSQNMALRKQADVKKQFGNLATNYFKSSQCGSAQSHAGKDAHPRTKPSLENRGRSQTDLSDTQSSELTHTSQKQNVPDVFVFPDCVVKESARCEWRKLNKQEMDETVADCSIVESIGSQTTSNRINNGESDETDGLDSPMDMDDDSFPSNYRTSTSKYNMLPQFRAQDSLSPRVPWFTNDHTTLQSSVSESCYVNYDKNKHSMTFGRDTHPARFPDILTELDIVQHNNRSTTARNKTSSSEHHFPRTFYEHRTHEHRHELSAQSSHSKSVEIVDTSESEDICQYLEEQESMLNEWTDQAQSSLRKSDSDEWTGQTQSSLRKSDSNNNNRVRKNSLGRKELAHLGDDCPVKTTADTNVIYVSLNEVFSSASSDDMDYEYEDNNTTAYRGHASHVYDYGDEPDGKNRKLGWEHPTDQKSGDQRWKSLVSHTRQQNLASDGHQSATCLHKAHPLGVSLSGKPQLIVANNESLCREKISFIVQDAYPTATRIADHVGSPQSADCDSRILTTHSFQENEQKQHFHPSLDKNITPFFHKLSTQEIPLSDTIERKHVLSVTCKDVQTVQLHAHNNNVDFIINNDQFADEVDGLGDKNKNQTQEIDSQTASQKEDMQRKVIHCFDSDDQGSDAGTVSQSMAASVTNISDTNKPRDTPHDTPLTRKVYQEKQQSTPTVDIVTYSAQKMVDHLKKKSESCRSSLKHTNTETNTQDRFVQGYTKPADMYREMQANVSRKKQSDTSMEHIAVCQSPDTRLRRRKSDTSVGEVTESSLSRSQSSPSKLGLTEDIPANRSPVFFHRPWVDQDTHKQQTLIPSITPAPLLNISCLHPTSTSLMSGLCTNPALTAAPYVSTGASRRMIVPTQYLYVSPKQSVSSDYRQDELPRNRGSQFSIRSIGDTSNCEEYQLNPHKDLTAGPSTSCPPQDKQATEGRHKRKLEFSVYDFRKQQPPAQRQARQILPCLALHNLPESASTIKEHLSQEHLLQEHLSQEHDYNRNQSQENTQCWQEEVNPSTSLSRQQREVNPSISLSRQQRELNPSTSLSRQQRELNPSTSLSRQQRELNPSTSLSRQQREENKAPPRNEDEVDIRVQITDVFQESTRLLQRLEEIYQEDNRSCACSRIEQNILRSALDMFRALGNEASSREYWMNQLHQTNHVIKKTLDLAENFRRLCRHGRQITDVFPGSIVIRIKCPTVLSLVDLCDLHATGDLHAILYNILSQSVVFDRPGLTLTVTLDKSNVVTCQGYLLTKMDKHLRTRSGSRRRTHNKMRPMRGVSSAENLIYSPSSPCSNIALELCRSPLSGASAHAQLGGFSCHRERKFSFGEINRTAFQELNISSPTSPLYGRQVRDDTCQMSGKPDLILASSSRLNSPNVPHSPKLLTSPVSSPLTSPRKLSIRDIISEQENIDHNND